MEKSEQRSSVEPEIALDVIPALAHQPAGGMQRDQGPNAEQCRGGYFFSIALSQSIQLPTLTLRPRRWLMG